MTHCYNWLGCYSAKHGTNISCGMLWTIAVLSRGQNNAVQPLELTPKVLVATIDAQWEGVGDVGSVRYKPALLHPYLSIRILSYSN